MSISSFAEACKQRKGLPIAGALLFILATLGACSSKKPVTWEQEREEVLNEIAQLKAEQHTLRERMTLIEATLASMEARLANQTAGIAHIEEQLAALQREHTTARQPTVTRKPSDQELARKIEKIEATIKKAKPLPTPFGDVEEQKNLYTAAYLALKSRRFNEAVKGFERLLTKYPEGDLADEATYWLGESHLALGERQKAVKYFRQVIDRYPSSSKHAAALLRLGQEYEKSGQTKEAIQLFRRLIKEHPDNPAAQTAREHLETMDLEG